MDANFETRGGCRDDVRDGEAADPFLRGRMFGRPRATQSEWSYVPSRRPRTSRSTNAWQRSRAGPGARRRGSARPSKPTRDTRGRPATSRARRVEGRPPSSRSRRRRRNERFLRVRRSLVSLSMSGGAASRAARAFEMPPVADRSGGARSNECLTSRRTASTRRPRGPGTRARQLLEGRTREERIQRRRRTGRSRRPRTAATERSQITSSTARAGARPRHVGCPGVRRARLDEPPPPRRRTRAARRGRGTFNAVAAQRVGEAALGFSQRPRRTATRARPGPWPRSAAWT